MVFMMEWSRQQQSALNSVGNWIKSKDQQIYRLLGFAGSGKTTLAKHLAELQNGKVLFGAFTGKAAKVLRDKECWNASTIHSMIYTPERNTKTGEFEYYLNHESPCKDAALIIIDECSMVDPVLGKDLMSFNKPILVLGDPFQLPPVKGAGFFTDADPDYMLDEIHRQAAESPILRLATDIRTDRFDREPNKTRNCQVISRGDVDQQEILDAGTLIVGRNLTRNRYNGRMRELLGYTDNVPMTGETLICLRNDGDKNIFNGGIWQVSKRKKITKTKRITKVKMEVTDPDDPHHVVDVTVPVDFFKGRGSELDWRLLKGLQQFDYGYAITAHKSQGSQWNHVVVFDESRVFGDTADRWLYTAVTRAAEKLTLVL